MKKITFLLVFVLAAFAFASEAMAAPKKVAGPQNLALCVMDRNGKYLYMSPEQWQQTPESAKISYVKKGVCLMENGDGFLVDMQDKGNGKWDYACSNGAPKVWQLKLMYKWRNALNQALRIYGGSPLVDTDGNKRWWFWSCEANHNGNSGLRFSMKTGLVTTGSKTSGINRVRAVLPLPSSANNSF